jgi:hypothetical protein
LEMAESEAVDGGATAVAMVVPSACRTDGSACDP